MNARFPAVETALQALATAIRAADASAIYAASEALALAVAEIDVAATDRSGRQEIHALDDLLAQLEALSIEVNLHSGWTRQRIDSLAELRGQRHLVSGRYC
jgi:hypothetical protein